MHLFGNMCKWLNDREFTMHDKQYTTLGCNVCKIMFFFLLFASFFFQQFKIFSVFYGKTRFPKRIEYVETSFVLLSESDSAKKNK